MPISRVMLSAFATLILGAALVLTGFQRPSAGDPVVTIPQVDIVEQTNAATLRSSLDGLPLERREVPAESLSFVVASGEVLIFNLPTSFGAQEIDTYRLKRAPALSWLVERSYFWRTLAKDVGEHTIVFEGLAGGRVAEEVYVLVDVR
ncbi:MAG: hypothetical protein R2834_00840 [Rhodothermales bacterium]